PLPRGHSLPPCLRLSLIARRPPCSTLFPYTTLFRSTQGTLRHLMPRLETDIVDDERSEAGIAHVQRGGCGIPLCLKRAVAHAEEDRKSTRLNSSHVKISYAVFCLKKKTRTGAGAPQS